MLQGASAKEASFRYRTRRTKHAMGTKRFSHAAVDLGQGRIGMFAGFGKKDVEVFDVRKETFQRLPCTQWSSNFQGIALGDGKALLVDGTHDCVFDLPSQRFIPTKNTFRVTRVGCPAMVPLPDGRVFLCAGYDDRRKSLDHCAVFDPKTRHFAAVGKLCVPRANPTANWIGDGRILIAGGRDAGGEHCFDTLEVFDVAAGTSKLLPARLHEARSHHAGVALSDGAVLFAGGSNASGFLRSAEVFDPKTGAVTRVGSLGIERSWPRAARLPSGRVAFFGDQNDIRVVELYCPRQRKFALADQLLIDAHSSGFTVTSLKGGAVLIVGGRINNGGDTLDTAEIFTETEVPPQPQLRVEVRDLVRQLGDDEHDVREAATRKLIKMGPDISDEIRPLLRHDDPEIRTRAGVILKAITGRRAAPKWCVEVWQDKRKQQTLWFEEFSCPRGTGRRDRRLLDVKQAAAKYKAAHLVARFPSKTGHEQRVRLANLVGWSRIPIIYLGDPL